MSTTPGYLPLLSRGAHRNPAEGACLMEYVSQLAGEGFSDQPRCTDPVLAAVARQVNDHISDTARPRLAVLAPQLAAARRIDPRLVPAVAAHCARVALQRDPGNRWLQRVVRRAESRINRSLDPATGRLRVALSNGLGGFRTLIPLAVRHVILQPARPDPISHDHEKDRVLFELLTGCLHEASRDPAIAALESTRREEVTDPDGGGLRTAPVPSGSDHRCDTL